jgi:hypothetical protein
MDATTMPAPPITALDALTQGIAALCYLGVGLTAWVHAPRDVRTRIFFAFSLANLVALAVPVMAWVFGIRTTTALPRGATAATLAALGVGALLLFHLTQVFPRRRPWIREAGIQMSVAYLLTPIAIAALVRFAPASVAELKPPYILGLVVFGFPLIVLLGFVLPVAAVVSLLRSHRDAQQLGQPIARPIAWILLSQVAGGVLAIVFLPVISRSAPGTALVAVLTLLIWLFGLLTPAAFAAAVWRYGLLGIDPD